MLKILFHQETRRILGVHSIGESSAEIIHVGQAVMEFGGTIDYFGTRVQLPDDGGVLQGRRATTG